MISEPTMSFLGFLMTSLMKAGRLSMLFIALILAITSCGSSPAEDLSAIEVVEDGHYVESGWSAVATAVPQPTTRPLEGEPVFFQSSAPADGATGEAPTNDMELLAVDVRNRLILQSGCGTVELPNGVAQADPATITRIVADLADDVGEAMTAFYAAQTIADEACAADEAAWTAATGEAISALAAAEEALGTRPAVFPPFPPVARSGQDVSVTTAAMTMMYDRIHFALSEPSPSDLWHSPAHYAQVRGLRDLNEDEAAAELIVLGDSVAARGVDAMTISAELNLVAVNMGLFSSYPEGQLALTEQVLRSDNPEVIVWVLYPHIIFTKGCQHQQRIAIDPVAVPQTIVELAFAPLPWVAGIDKEDLLFGVAGSVVGYGGTQLDERARNLYGSWVENRGTPFSQDGVDTDRIEFQIDASTGRYENPEPCQARLDSIATGVEAFVDAGHDVLVVVPPAPDALAALHPDGWKGHDEVAATIEADTTAGGAMFVDLSRAVAEEDFHDLLHVNTDGRPVFTTGVVDALQAMGAAKPMFDPETFALAIDASNS